MHSLKSRNTELNTYINSFLNIHYQPQKMLWWRVGVLLVFGLGGIVMDYQHYDFTVEQWFSWTPLFVLLAGFLTLNFQSLYLGSMSFQYRYHDTVFVIARRFSTFNYASVIQGLENKLANRRNLCQRSQISLVFLFIGILGLVKGRVFLWPLIVNQGTQSIVYLVYMIAIISIISVSAIASILILKYKRQLELLELSLFWIKLASSIKYIG